MEALLFGLGTALAWGTADFIARFTSRGYGTSVAIAGMLFTSSVILTLVAYLLGELTGFTAEGWHWLLLAGLGVYGGTGLLYWGLARGPISVVAPIAASYPVFNLALAAIRGIEIGAFRWGLLFSIIGGVALISATARHQGAPETGPIGRLRTTLLIAIGASVGLACGVTGLQFASHYQGDWQTLIYARWIGTIAAVLALLLLERDQIAFSPKLSGLLVVQGVLDGFAYLMLILGSGGAGAAIVVVVASCFTIVTLALARIILKERISMPQAFGIALVVCSVAALGYLDGH